VPRTGGAPAPAESRLSVHADLARCLDAERMLSLLSVQLIDLPRLEHHYGQSAVRLAEDAFGRLVVAEFAELVGEKQLVAVVASEKSRVDFFIRHGDSVIGPRQLENVADRLATRTEDRMRAELSRAGLGLVRVVSGHGTHLATPS